MNSVVRSRSSLQGLACPVNGSREASIRIPDRVFMKTGTTSWTNIRRVFSIISASFPECTRHQCTRSTFQPILTYDLQAQLAPPARVALMAALS